MADREPLAKDSYAVRKRMKNRLRSITLEDRDYDIIKHLGRNNASRGIRMLVKFYLRSVGNTTSGG